MLRFVPSVIVSGVLLVSSASAQSVPLPEELEAVFTTTIGDTIVHDFTGGKRVRGDVTFDNMEGTQSVFIRWIAESDDGAYPGVLDQEFTVSFKPTGVCRKAGQGDSLFVVGWNERRSEVIIERWDFTFSLFGQVPHIPTGATVNVAVAPSLVRHEYASFASVTPAKGMLYNHFGGTVLLLLGDPVHEIVSVEDGLGPVTLFHAGAGSGTLITDLDTMNSITGCVHQSLGFVGILTSSYAWDGTYPGDFDDEEYILIIDTDSDGVFEAVQQVTGMASLQQVVGQGSWDQSYQ